VGFTTQDAAEHAVAAHPSQVVAEGSPPLISMWTAGPPDLKSRGTSERFIRDPAIAPLVYLAYSSSSWDYGTAALNVQRRVARAVFGSRASSYYPVLGQMPPALPHFAAVI
jgi:hypothetical protein